MALQHVIALAAAHGQSWTQVAELLLAFALSGSIGMERQIRGKSAGLRTQTIVGTSSALILLVSKYGFGDVLSAGTVVLDPSRVAAQIVSGIGFLGAGLIITRQGAVRGLTTAASVWETAAIGMAAGAGLPLLALLVTALHFVIVLGFTWLTDHFPGSVRNSSRLTITYREGQGVLRQLLAASTGQGWTVTAMVADVPPPPAALRELTQLADPDQPVVSVILQLTGDSVANAANTLAGVDGVIGVEQTGDETE